MTQIVFWTLIGKGPKDLKGHTKHFPRHNISRGILIINIFQDIIFGIYIYNILGTGIYIYTKHFPRHNISRGILIINIFEDIIFDIYIYNILGTGIYIYD